MLKLSDRVDAETDIEETSLVMIEETLEKAERLAFYATLRLDELATLKEEEKALMQARPKLTYETFTRAAGTFNTFQRNQKEIYKAFEKEGEGQQIYQLSKILSTDLATTVLSFSGAQDGPKKSRIRETLNLSTNADHKTDIYFFLGGGWSKIKNLKLKNLKKIHVTRDT